MRVLSFSAIGVCVAMLFAASSCGDEHARFSVNSAPSFQKEARKISVFGVFRDGRMSVEAWEDLTPRIRGILHGNESCDAAIGNGLRVLNPPLFSATDTAARRQGISDEMLEKFAAAAEGDDILVIMMSGATSDAGAQTMLTDNPNGGGGMPSGRGGAGRRGNQPVPTQIRKQFAGSRLEINGWLYSKREKKSVFNQSLVYTGSSDDDAFNRFVARLGEALPGAACAGWKADLGVDPHALEEMREE